MQHCLSAIRLQFSTVLRVSSAVVLFNCAERAEMASRALSVVDHSSLFDYTDAELVEHIRNSPRLSADLRCNIYRLSGCLVAKRFRREHVQDTEEAMNLAHQLGVRAPRVLRTVSVSQKDESYLVVELITGTSLEEAWPRLGWFTTIKLALELRHFVSKLRSQRSPSAGSLVSGACRSFWLEDWFGLPAHASPTAVSSFIEFWCAFVSIPRAMRRAAKRVKSTPTTWVPPVPKAFVLTHHDLAPRNMQLDDAGQLWLLDWDLAGWYPEYFEYAAMYNFLALCKWPWLARLRWHLFTYISVGGYPKEERLLSRIRDKFSRFGAGCKFDIVYNGLPSAKPASLD